MFGDFQNGQYEHDNDGDSGLLPAASHRSGDRHAADLPQEERVR